MAERIHEHRHPERVGQQNKFLPLGVALLPDGREKLDASKPLGFG